MFWKSNRFIKNLFIEKLAMKKIVSCLVVTFSVVFVGCAAPARYGYVKEGSTQAQGVDAMSECRYQIQLNKTATEKQNELLQLCMQGKGFRLRRIN